MRFTSVVSIVFCAALACSGPASAQTLRTSNGPAEAPPANFAGNQYIDSHGCAYIRAGYGGKVTWVPRVTRDRKLVCGMTPTTLAAVSGNAVTRVQPTPVPATQNVARAVPVASVTPAPPEIKVPKGFKAAWSDGRLNPNRGPKTAVGDAQMRAIWADTLPQQLVGKPKPSAPPAPKRRKDRDRKSSGDRAKSLIGVFSAGKVTVSSKGNASTAAGQYVQVATFGQSENAKATLAKLQGAGLPVSTSTVTRSGNDLFVVLVGPLVGANSVSNAMQQVRSIGFSDAFLR